MQDSQKQSAFPPPSFFLFRHGEQGRDGMDRQVDQTTRLELELVPFPQAKRLLSVSFVQLFLLPPGLPWCVFSVGFWGVPGSGRLVRERGIPPYLDK